jgi:hypothetical protein
MPSLLPSSTNTISIVWQARGRGDEPRVERAQIFFFVKTGTAMDISAIRLAAQVSRSCACAQSR